MIRKPNQDLLWMKVERFKRLFFVDVHLTIELLSFRKGEIFQKSNSDMLDNIDRTDQAAAILNKAGLTMTDKCFESKMISINANAKRNQ